MYKGKWKYGNRVTDVLVKSLKQESDNYDKIIFLQEAVILNKLKHPNVITLCGVVDGDPVSMNITER